MGWLAYILVILALIIILIIKKMKKKEDYLDLDSRLSGIKNRWDDCCKKILGKFGI